MQQMNIAARLAIHSAAPDRRRKDRVSTRLPTLISTPGLLGIKATVVDISIEGFQLDVGAYLTPDTIIRLNLPRIGMVLCKVIWAKKGKIGGVFINPMSQQRLNAVLGSAGALPA